MAAAVVVKDKNRFPGGPIDRPASGQPRPGKAHAPPPFRPLYCFSSRAYARFSQSCRFRPSLVSCSYIISSRKYMRRVFFSFPIFVDVFPGVSWYLSFFFTHNALQKCVYGRTVRNSRARTDTWPKYRRDATSAPATERPSRRVVNAQNEWIKKYEYWPSPAF